VTAVSAPPRGQAAAPRAPELALLNLRNESVELARLLAGRVEREDALNAFLLAAGLLQIAEDVIEADRLRLADVHRLLAGAGRRLPAAAVARAGSALAAAAPVAAPLRAHAAALEAIVDVLAGAVMAGGPPAAGWPALAELVAPVVAGVPAIAELRGRVLRLPACFRGFDQHPDDLARLARRFAKERPAREAPVAVVGVRTSGSYLAPLTAAALRALGHDAVALSARPSHVLARPKLRRLRALASAGGVAVVTDDPPASGDSIARVAATLEATGFGERDVIALFATHAGAAPPRALRGRHCVTLPWDDWSVHERLEPDAVAGVLEQLWPGTRVGAVERVAADAGEGRGHVSARFRVTIDEPGSGTREVAARGVGLGYFGDHSPAVARALGGWLPEPHGVSGGLAFRRWLPEEERARPSEADVAGYAAARERRLPLPSDPTAGLGGQDPVWEVAANILSRAYARGWRPMRVAAVDAIARELLRPARPCVIDGRMEPGAWFAGPLKLWGDERAFSNRNLACCDAAYDVAAAAALGGYDPALLRGEFARASGEWIDDERWLVYQLVAAWAARRDGLLDPAGEARVSARALGRWFAGLFLSDLPPAAGPVCALDIDGVLETETIGAPSLSPAGALALRALVAHGYRPLLASGRSAAEVAERCAAYGLAGGVAEYGAALVLPGDEPPRSLVSDAGAAAAGRARAALAERPGVEVGRDHTHAIRAWRRDEAGRRGALAEDDIRAALAAAGQEPLRAVPGESQTDLVPGAVDKGRGVLALASELGGERRIALAVGDAVEDLPMLRLADAGVAPANADTAVRRAGIRRTRAGYQAGLAQAVAELIGHAPGGCPACAAPRPGRRAELLLGVLGAREAGAAGLGPRALRTVARGRRSRAAR
jgi:trehalose-6-phosphatase